MVRLRSIDHMNTQNIIGYISGQDVMHEVYNEADYNRCEDLIFRTGRYIAVKFGGTAEYRVCRFKNI